MRAVDIIRGVLDMIDSMDAAQQPPVTVAVTSEPSIEAPLPDELARMKQIAGLIPQHEPAIANEPCEQIADIDAVTVDAGGGVNGPKHPADMRSDSISMYPAAQWRGE